MVPDLVPNQRPPVGRKSLGDAQHTTVSLAKGDRTEIEYIMERMGLGKAEAIRTSIRVYAAILRKG